MKEEIKTSVGSVPVVKKVVSRLKEKNKTGGKSTTEKKWIEVVPHGLVGGMVPNLCLMVFKEKEGTKRFAVSLSRLQGQISVHQSMQKEEPFRFVGELLNRMKVKIEKCYFLKYDKGNIIMQVIVSGHPGVHSINLKADDVIPFAVYSGSCFYCTEQFMMEMLDQKIEQPMKKGAIRKPLYLN